MSVFRPSAIVLLVAAGCSTERQGEPKTPSTRKSTTMRFPYDMPAEQKTKFIAAVRTLKVGDSHAEVVRILGIPYSEEPICAKERCDAPVTGTFTTYCLKKERQDNVNQRLDEYVNLIFDNGGRLVEKSTNVVGLSLWDHGPSSGPMDRSDMPSTRRRTTTAVGR